MLRLLLVLVCCGYCCGQSRPVVTTSCGTVQGIYMKSRNNRPYSAFLSIPYAEPPIGDLRFEPPQPIKECPKFIDAGKEGAPCLQPAIFFPSANKTFIGSEDCLTLNIFTPSVTSSKPLPVMVYFFEGSWLASSSALGLHGPEYFMDENVILVTANNRVNIFGYLSTEDTVVPGNMALKDQVAVLRYVNKNIKFFNGDSKQVTLFGQSAGASAIALHMRSSLSSGLFKQGISMSGTANSQYSLIGVGTPLKYTRIIADSLNCNRNCTKDLINCLKQLPAENLLKSYWLTMLTEMEMKVFFLPVVEHRNVPGAFLTKTSLVTNTAYNWMTGFTTLDGAFRYSNLVSLGIEEKLAEFDKEWDIRGPLTLLFDDTASDPVDVARKIRKYYFKDDPITVQKEYDLIDLYTNFYLTNPMIQDIGKNWGNTYVYQFDHIGEFTNAHHDGLPANQSYNRAMHGDELIYLFTMNNLFPNAKLNQTDTNISRLMIKLWTNFAITGKPTPIAISNNPQNPSAKGNLVWKPFGNQRNYLLIQTNSVSMQTNLFKEKYAFWQTLKINDKLRSNFDSNGYLKQRSE